MTIKLITSNIRYANSGDGAHDWSSRKPLLVDIYANFLPDILGTQEGRIVQLKELDQSLEKLILVDAHRKWIEERMYPCLFINPETIEIENSGDIWLSETPYQGGSSSFGSTFPRLCTWAELTFKKSGLQIMAVNTHLDHILAETRKNQIQVLIQEIKKINKRAIFIMGDFNESPNSQIKDELTKAFNLIDPWIEKNLPEEPSHHSFQGEKARKGERIDWILIPKNFKCESIYLEKGLGTGGIYPSDHYPLLATVIPK